MSEQAPSVLFLLSSLATGGSELKTVRLANALASRGLPVMLACLGPPFTLRGEIDAQVPFVDLRRRGKFSIRSLRLLAHVVRERQVRTIVAVNPYPALYGRLVRILLRGPKPRLIATVNTTDPGSGKLALQMPLYRRILRSADLVILGAEAQRRLWSRQYGVGTDDRRTRVIYNGVDTERFAVDIERFAVDTRRFAVVDGGSARSRVRAEDRNPRRFVIGTVGQMRPEKAHLDLVRATAILRSRGVDVQALLVGDGSERARIEEEISALGMRPHIVLAGEQRDVRPSLALMDVFVLPSTAVETFSNAALEALSCGIPIVASDIGGIRELLAYGGGVTYPPGDVARLCECLDLLLRDHRYRAQLAAEARLAVEEHFSWNRMVQDFVTVLAPGMNVAESPRWHHRISPQASAS